MNSKTRSRCFIHNSTESMFQVSLQTNDTIQQLPSDGIFNLLTPYLWFSLYVVIGIFFVTCAMMIIKKSLWRAFRLSFAFNKVVLLITVPRESLKEQEQQKTEQSTKEAIAVAETLFSTIGGMKAERGFSAFWLGRKDTLSFEIVAHNDLISFYVVVPKNIKQYIEQQIHAQYPSAEVLETTDYNIFYPDYHIVGSYLNFRKSYIFPIKTYKTIGSDTLEAVINSLSKIRGQDGAAIQIVVRSARKEWHTRGIKVAQAMHQGKKLNEAINIASGHMLLSIVNFIAGGAHESFKKKEELGKESYKMTQIEGEMLKGIEEKSSKAGVDANIRLIVSAKDKILAEQYLQNIEHSFAQFNLYEYGNVFHSSKPMFSNKELIIEFIYRHFNEKKQILLNSEEMASIYHLPLPTNQTPNIRWLSAKKYTAPNDLPNQGITLGFNEYRGERKEIRIAKDDRRRHVYIIGTTGSGKSVLMQEMAKQDIKNGDGVCVIDPHGSLIEDILPCIPKERIEDVILFDPSDVERPIGLNMLEANTTEEKDFIVQEMILIFYKLVSDPSMIGPIFEHNMRNAMLTLMADKEYPGTLVDIPRMFTDTEFQKYKLKHVTDVMVRAFWEKEMAKTTDYHKSEMLGYLISKLGRFIENEMVRNIIGQPCSGFNFKDVLENKKILLVNLSKGKIGEMPSYLLGLIIVSRLQIAAFSRAGETNKEHPDFYLYIDEFQNFITDSISTILSEARKYRLNLTMAHQYIGQLVNGQDTKIRDAIFGNVGSIAAFRVGVDDSELIAKQFAPVFNEHDVINIEKYNAYVRLLINNTVSRAFNMQTYPPIKGDPNIAKAIKEISRLKYGVNRATINADIIARSKLGADV